MRVVLDTNVLVSGLLFPGGCPSRLVAAWRAGAYELLLSDFLLEELQRSLQRLAPRCGLAPADVIDFIDLMRLRSEVIALNASALALAAASPLRDPDDLPILATLLAGPADWLVSGDKDLLALGALHPILAPAAFEARFMG